MYLAAAGVGKITLVDADTVDLTNLQRQILHMKRIGRNAKVESARETLAALNPGVKVIAVPRAPTPLARRQRARHIRRARLQR